MSIGVAVILLAYGAAAFGLGRVRHPANLKLSAVKAAIVKTEQEFEKEITLAGPAIIARIKSAL